MTEIVVACGDHTHATPALHWATFLAGRTGDDLVALNIFAKPFAEMPPDWAAQHLADRADLLDRTIDEAVDRWGQEFTRRREVIEGDPHDMLVERVRGGNVSYVVVGQHGATSFGGTGTAYHLIHHARIPVVVIPDRDRFDSGPVVVGVDGSPANAQALGIAQRLADQLGTDLVGVFCPDAEVDDHQHSRACAPEHERTVRSEMDGILLAEHELAVEAGHPVEALTRVAAEREASALVVGTRGRGGFGGLMAGRIPVQLIEHAPVPLVVVPHAGP